jgi:hypothetical protein
MSDNAKNPHSDKSVHEVTFVAYPKLLFVWPLLLAGFVFYPFGGRPEMPTPTTPTATPATVAPADAPAAADMDDATGEAAPVVAPNPIIPARPYSNWLGWLAWVYVWIALLVILTLGVDVDRNQAVFWIVLVIAVWVLGLWLRDTHHFTVFGDIYRWFVGLRLQYDRNIGFAISILLTVPFIVMLLWARLNNKWRITHNEFEHYAFGKMDDSLGRGAKTIRTLFPDVFELLLGLAGTLIVYNATGSRELRRIPHVMFLPMVRERLNKILERTAITAGDYEDDEDDEDIA